MFRKKWIFLLSFLLLLFSNQSFTQSSNHALHAFLDSVDNLYGTNDLLVNGYPYRLPDDEIKGHPYLFGQEWRDATLYISGHAFENQQARYNIVEDILIIKARVEQGSKLLVRTNRMMIDSFKIEDQLFVNSSLIFEKDSEPGFYQVIYDGEVQFIRKYSKQFVSDYGGTSPHGKFSSPDEERYLLKGGELESVNSRWSFIRYFPKKKRKAIRGFLREHSLRYSRAGYDELVDLSNFCFK